MILAISVVEFTIMYSIVQYIAAGKTYTKKVTLLIFTYLNTTFSLTMGNNENECTL